VPGAERLGGPRLEASFMPFVSEECSDCARSFRKARLSAACIIHAQLDAAAAAVHATRVGGWQQLTASVPSHNPSAAVAIAG
jgi:hypothetical protein